jgi:hypothetical protein
MTAVETALETALAALPCSERAEALGEDMAGTAPEERTVLVIEQSGPWGRDAVSESGLRPIADALAAHAKAAGTRIQVVRRSTRRYAVGRPAAWLAGLQPGRRFLERLDVGDPRELLELDLGAGPTGAGTLQDGPLLLSCTHSTRDPCCARRGLPLHRALCETGADTWHASHLGGHRFAATMAALPLGAWLGRVPTEEAADIVALLRAGRLPLAYLRGRAGEPAAVQAAEVAVRRHAGIDRVDDLAVEAVDGEQVRFLAHDGRRFEVDVRAVPTGHVRAVSCGPDAKREDPGGFDVTLVGAGEQIR